MVPFYASTDNWNIQFTPKDVTLFSALPLMIDYQSLLPLVTDDRKEFLQSTNGKILFFKNMFFLTFYFYRQVIKK